MSQGEGPKGARLPYKRRSGRGKAFGEKSENVPSHYLLDIGGTKIIGDVTVETRGGNDYSRLGDVARSLFGTRVIR